MAVPGVRFWGLKLMSTLSAAGPDCHHARLPEPGGDGGRGLSQGRRRSHAAAGAACLNPPPVNRGSDRPHLIRTYTKECASGSAAQWRVFCNIKKCAASSSMLPQVSILPLGWGGPSVLCVTPANIAQVPFCALTALLAWCSHFRVPVPRDGTHYEVASRNLRGAVCQVSACNGSGAKAKPIHR